MNPTIGIVLAVGLIFLLIQHGGGWRMGIATATVVMLALLPGHTVLGHQITPLLLGAVAIIAVLSSRDVSVPWRFAPLAIYLLLCSLLYWTWGPAQADRLAVLGLGALAWICGEFAAVSVTRTRSGERVMAVMLLTVLGIQSAVMLLQWSGAQIFAPLEVDEDLDAGRVAGTFSHPGNVGKVIVLLLVMALPLSKSRDVITRRAATASIFLSFVPIGLSQSRANYLAIIAVLLTWAIVLPRSSGVRARIAIPAGVFVVGLVFLQPILDRFSSDPEGGARSYLLQVAFDHMGPNLWFGVGPGDYIDYFGQYDPVTAAGWPVHNAFVLQAAELGIIGAVLLFVPLLIAPVVVAARSYRASPRAALDAGAIIALCPGLIVIAVTGWSLTSGDIAYAYFFVMGYAVKRLHLQLQLQPHSDAAVDDVPDAQQRLAAGARL